MKTRYAVLILLLVAASVSIAAHSIADEAVDHREKRHHAKQNGHDNKEGHEAAPRELAANNGVYEGLCGSCHWAYAPQLLPKKSWENMLASLGDHFGAEVTLSEQDKRAVANHLLSNAADVSSTEIGRKVMRSLRGATPSRVVEVHYILKKHRELAPEVFARKGVGGLANCIACHPGAGSLDFEDDRVGIPAQ